MKGFIREMRSKYKPIVGREDYLVMEENARVWERKGASLVVAFEKEFRSWLYAKRL